MKIIVDRLPESEKDCPYSRYATGANIKENYYQCLMDRKKCNLFDDYFRRKCRWLQCYEEK